jgi:4'-phosphopantetheinyl transferase
MLAMPRRCQFPVPKPATVELKNRTWRAVYRSTALLTSVCCYIDTPMQISVIFPGHLSPVTTLADNAAYAQAPEHLDLWWADPGAAQDYDEALLMPQDRPRAALHRSPRADLEWRTSRAALAYALTVRNAPTALSLSHRHGHALVAAAPSVWKLGVDLERVQSRNVDILTPWCCTDEEVSLLSSFTGEARLQAFYLLWTLKEAFVKAAGLDFPADMKTVGLISGGQGWTLCAPDGGNWCARSALLGPDWVASVVWCADADASASAAAGAGAEVSAHVEPVWRSAPHSVLPQPGPAWRWTMPARA